MPPHVVTVRKSQLFAWVLVDVIGQACLYPGRNPLEAVLPLERSIDILRTKQIADSRLNDKIYRSVIADMVSRTWIRGRTVDSQIPITHGAAEEFSPIVCIPELSGTCGRGY